MRSYPIRILCVHQEVGLMETAESRVGALNSALPFWQKDPATVPTYSGFKSSNCYVCCFIMVPSKLSCKGKQ